MKKLFSFVAFALLALHLHAQMVINGARAFPQPNDGTTGTTQNLLAKINTAGNAIKATVTDTAVPVYITTSATATTGNASLVMDGIAPCTMDATLSSTGGFFVIASTTTAGNCHAQSSVPSGVWVVGTLVSSSTTSGSTALVNANGYYVVNASGSGTVTNISTNSPVSGGPITTTGTISCPTCVTSAASLTNKGIVIGQGGQASATIDFPDTKIIPAAECNGSSFGSSWDLPSTNAPTVACRAGTNNLGGVLQWANNNTTTNAQFSFELPADWDSASQPFISIYYGSGSNATGTVKWTFSSACTKNDGSITDDPAFVAETTTTGKTMAVANRMWSENIQFANVTGANNCVAGSNVIVKITSGNGTAASAVNVSKVVLTIPRLLTVQAN